MPGKQETCFRSPFGDAALVYPTRLPATASQRTPLMLGESNFWHSVQDANSVQVHQNSCKQTVLQPWAQESDCTLEALEMSQQEVSELGLPTLGTVPRAAGGDKYITVVSGKERLYWGDLFDIAFLPQLESWRCSGPIAHSSWAIQDDLTFS